MSLSDRQYEYLKLMGIDAWRSRGREQKPDPVSGKRAGKDTFPGQPPAGEWLKLQEQVTGCRKCRLHEGRIHTVFGTGSENAEWMLIGEAPGAEEDRQGKPFVGRAGRLLTAMLQAVDLDREQVFIANILKCRPPGNRNPEADEIAACADYLRRQIQHIRPVIILALGRIAAQNLLNVDTPISRMRGNVYRYHGTEIPIVVTYHPAYLLRAPKEKRKAWEDLRFAVTVYRETLA